METLFEQVQNGRLWPLTGGVHPHSHKSQTSSAPIGQMALPEQLIIPLKQHIGVPGRLLVSEGDLVLKGQPLTEAVKGLSLPVHAPTSGQISKISDHLIAHPAPLAERCIFLTPDGKEQWVERDPQPHFRDLPPESLIERIKQAGIAGLGGAGFPAFVKSATQRQIEYLIINATECEPYITADDVLIQSSAEAIIQGIEIVAAIIKPTLILIGIEADKPAAIAQLTTALEHRTDIQLRVFPPKYPSGGEKQLIQILTGQQVPSGGLPMDIGILAHNIGTIYGIYKAIVCGEPLISRIVTVTGKSIHSPQNLEVLIGTPIESLLNHCGFSPTADQRLIMGGPMMGFALNSASIPIVKISNCLLAPGKGELPSPQDEMPCIRCSACADACPVSLLPQQLYWYSKTKAYDKVQEYNLKDCIECGACAYVCPSEIPLVQYYRVAKGEIKTEQLEKQQAEQAKARFEARKLRLERDAQEREEKQRLASEKRKLALAKSGAGNAVADALARVKAKKALAAAQATGETPEPTVAAKPAESQATSEQKPLSSAALAVARAKERKRLQQAQTQTQAQENGDTPTVTPETTAAAAPQAPSEQKPLSGAALAVAKAKERQRLKALAAQTPAEPSQDAPSIRPSNDDESAAQ